LAAYETYYVTHIGLLIMSQQSLKLCTLACTHVQRQPCHSPTYLSMVHLMPNMQQMLLQFIDIVYLRLIVCYLQRIF